MIPSEPPAPPPRGLSRLLHVHHWIAPVVPLVVYMLLGSLEPTPTQAGGKWFGLAIPYGAYPWLYTAKIALTLLAIVLVWPGYPPLPRRVSLLAVAVGAVGIVVWVGLWHLGLERKLLDGLGLGALVDLGQRPALNPWQAFHGQPALAWAFLAVRLLGLVVVVPLIEEFFLRGFLIRFVMAADWWEVPFGRVNATAVAVSLIVPALMHPAEILPAVAWFGMITWLMVRTKSLWDCIAAHAVTNLLLGIYVLATGQWALW